MSRRAAVHGQNRNLVGTGGIAAQNRKTVKSCNSAASIFGFLRAVFVGRARDPVP